MERKCRECQAFYECKRDKEVPTGGGWEEVYV